MVFFSNTYGRSYTKPNCALWGPVTKIVVLANKFRPLSIVSSMFLPTGGMDLRRAMAVSVYCRTLHRIWGEVSSALAQGPTQYRF
jgi:hypothetical protein